jgi:hypothetical protein
MNPKYLAILAALPIAFTACKKDEDTPAPTPVPTTAAMKLSFNFVSGIVPFNINNMYTDGAGNAIRFSTLKFYVSDVHLMDDDDNVVGEFHDSYLLVDGASSSNVFDLGAMNAGHVHMINFSLGLDSPTNHADPLTAAYPLNIPGMHWSWDPSAGYKFLNMEGLVDGNGDGDVDDTEDVPFTYHCVTDALLREDSFHQHEDVAGGATVTLAAKVDVNMLLMGMDLLSASVAMGGGPNNQAAMNNLVMAIDAQ